MFSLFLIRFLEFLLRQIGNWNSRGMLLGRSGTDGSEVACRGGERASRRVYTANELDFADGGRSIVSGGGRRLRLLLLSCGSPGNPIKRKGDYGFLNIPGEIITRLRNPTAGK